MPSARGSILTPVIVAGLLACSPPGGSALHNESPEALARSLFDFGRIDEPAEDDLRRGFEAEPLDRHRAALLDALESIGAASGPEVVAVQPLAGSEEVAVDLVANLEGGGRAHFSVSVIRREPDSWRVRWFQGPGVEWPPARPRDGESLSSSPPPD